MKQPSPPRRRPGAQRFRRECARLGLEPAELSGGGGGDGIRAALMKRSESALPDLYLEACRRSGVAESRSVAIGDAPGDGSV